MENVAQYVWFALLVTLCQASISEDLINKRLQDAVAASQFVHVSTPLGKITGVKSIETNVYIGIPYAKQPKRWEDPVYPDHSSTRKISAYALKPMCPQICREGPYFCLNQVSENCLYLNVYQPLDASNSNKKAVMVYIHGGGFTRYSGGSPIHYGERFAKNADVIFVTFNFRLGAIGFLAAGKGTKLEGNYGLKDQIMALRWVNENIAYFGGDPEKVTLIGHSAGAQSVALHLLNNNSFPTFHRVILQSTPWTIPFRTYDEAKFQTQAIAVTVGCSVIDDNVMIDCMKKKSVDEIVQAQKLFEMSQIDFTDSFSLNFNQRFGPVIDGNYVTGNLEKMFKRKKVFTKDVILGSGKEEGYYYYLENFPYMNVLDIARNNKRDVKEFVQLYPPINAFDGGVQLSDSMSDVTFTCASIQFAKYSDKGENNVYLYLFDHALPMNETVWGELTACYGKSCHSFDLYFLFQVFNDILPLEDLKVANDLARYWGNFARTGDPNDGSLPLWKSYKRGRRNKTHLIFKSTERVSEVVPFRKECKFWNKGIGFLT